MWLEGYQVELYKPSISEIASYATIDQGCPPLEAESLGLAERLLLDFLVISDIIMVVQIQIP